MNKERILVAVKTYPTLSAKHIELTCIAGFKEDGSWIRLYPTPFRFLDFDQRFKKYQWIELEIEKNSKDSRPESFRPRDISNISLSQFIPTDQNWELRRNLILLKNTVHTNLNTIIGAAKRNEYSLVIFKPSEVKDFLFEEVEREWSFSKREAAEAALKQGSLFDDMDRSDFKLMPKLPYKFSYRFADNEGKESTLMIIDWEIGQLYWNCLKKEGDEQAAIAKVKQKYFYDFTRTKDLHLFLGTTKEWHKRAPNPYVIIGTFHPPFNSQPSLF